LKFYAVMVVTTRLYGYETWPKENKIARKIQGAEINILNSVTRRTTLKVNVELSLYLTTHTKKTYWSGGIALHILDLGNRWR